MTMDGHLMYDLWLFSRFMITQARELQSYLQQFLPHTA